MHAVVNHLPLQQTTDWLALSRTINAFEATLRAQHPNFRGCSLIRSGGILIVSFDTQEALDTISKNVAAPWFAEHVRPLFAGVVLPSAGEVVAGTVLR